MILTGAAILDAVKKKEIVINPFTEDALNPNSVNYKLGEEIYSLSYTERNISGHPTLEKLQQVNGRYLLRAGHLYLGHTLEVIGSDVYVTSLIGRSSIGRLGLFVQVSANIGHVGAIHAWTLELFPTIDIFVYPKQNIGQVSFWKCIGEQHGYEGWFGRHNLPKASKLHDSEYQTVCQI